MHTIDYKPLDIARSQLPLHGLRRSFTTLAMRTARKDINQSQKTFNVIPGGSIQAAIESAKLVGGGIVFLKNGTYYPKGNLTMYSNITLMGENLGAAIIDFESAAYQLQIVGSSSYSTGTVSVTEGATAVTGSGTSWSANVSAGQAILLQGIWYPVGAVGSDTSITLAIPYAGTTLSGATYVAATTVKDAIIQTIRFSNSTTDAIKAQYCNNFRIDNCQFVSDTNGLDADDCSQLAMEEGDFIACNTGLTLTNTHFSNFNYLGVLDALASHGFTLDTCTNCSFFGNFVLNSAGDGYNITSSSNIAFSACSIRGNGGQGIELVSGNSDVTVAESAIQSNTGDGIKLTATADNIMISNCSIKSNGAYGVNLAASTCDDNLIIGNVFASNTTAATNNSVTGTLIRSNIGAADN